MHLGKLETHLYTTSAIMYGIVLLSVDFRLIGTFSPRRVPTIATTLTVDPRSNSAEVNSVFRSYTVSFFCGVCFDNDSFRSFEISEGVVLMVLGRGGSDAEGGGLSGGERQ